MDAPYRYRTRPLLHAELTEAIIGCAFDVHKELGPGFLESVYERALRLALRQQGWIVQSQHPVRVMFRGASVGCFYADLLVDRLVVVELKAARSLAPAHLAQVINYLKAADLEVGLLLNFARPRLELKRLIRQKFRRTDEELAYVDERSPGGD